MDQVKVKCPDCGQISEPEVFKIERQNGMARYVGHRGSKTVWYNSLNELSSALFGGTLEWKEDTK